MGESRTQLRTAAQRRRAAANPDACRIWSQIIQAKVLQHPAYLSAKCLAVYRAIGNEVDTAAIIDHSLHNEKRVLVPGPVGPHGFVQFSQEVCSPERGGSLHWVSASDLRAEASGLLVIVPGVLFDPYGHRLGRGGGWYDRVLHALSGEGVYFGLAYEFQIISRIPVESWDQSVHFVVTQERVIDCGCHRLFDFTQKC